MSVSDSDIAFARELFEGLGEITTRKMMGGLTLYSGGRIFALLDRSGRTYLKAKGPLAEALAAEGAQQFRPGGTAMPYWSLPEAALDDSDEACRWARRALAES